MLDESLLNMSNINLQPSTILQETCSSQPVICDDIVIVRNPTATENLLMLSYLLSYLYRSIKCNKQPFKCIIRYQRSSHVFRNHHHFTGSKPRLSSCFISVSVERDSIACVKFIPMLILLLFHSICQNFLTQ